MVIKALSIVIIVASLFYYNMMTEMNQELLTANQTIERISEDQIALADRLAANPNELISQVKTSAGAEADSSGKYKDGTYSGTAKGYGGPVTTRIVIEGGYIVGIEITSSDGEDAAYYNMCLGILDDIVAAQSADVDTVTGATYTSKGIIGGAKEALGKAEKE